MPTLSPPNLSRTARVFRALSDENRLRILAMLTSGERCVCELTAALDLAQSLLSHHLKTLKDAGLVTDRRDGRWVYYTLNSPALEGLGDTLDSLAAAAPEIPADCCP